MLAAATKEERKNELKKQYHLYLDSYLARDIFECVPKMNLYYTKCSGAVNARYQSDIECQRSLNHVDMDSTAYTVHDEFQTW